MISEAVHLSGKRPEAERAMAVFEAGQNRVLIEKRLVEAAGIEPRTLGNPCSSVWFWMARPTWVSAILASSCSPV